MNGYKGPLEVPGIGHLIAQAIEAFAKEKGLQADLWYQDQPLWFIRQEHKDENFFQAVEVAAFFTHDGEQLCFLPFAYRFEEGTLKKTPAAATQAVEHPLVKFSALKPDATRKKVRALLEQAWELASDFSAEDLTEQV
jgi:hypothetical protein